MTRSVLFIVYELRNIMSTFIIIISLTIIIHITVDITIIHDASNCFRNHGRRVNCRYSIGRLTIIFHYRHYGGIDPCDLANRR